jgi:integrase
MAQIIRRGSGWYSDFRSGKRRIRRFLSKDKREATIKLGELLAEMRGEYSGKPSQNISWAAFKAKYLEYSTGSKRPNSVLRDQNAINAIERTSPLDRLSQLTPEYLELLKGKRMKDGKRAPTINRDMTAIKALAHKAEAWGYMTKQDWTSVRPIKEARKKLYFHSPTELSRLLSKCNGVWRTLCLLGARAGLRREEIYMLTWADVEFDHNRIRIAAKDDWTPKDYEQRFIPMAADLREHLNGLDKSGRWVLGENRPSLAVMTAYFRKITRKANLKGTIHILRHTFASHLVQNGVELKTIKDLLGHESMKTTEIYAELIPDNFDDAVLKLPKIAGSGAGSGQSIGKVISGKVR